ncbi:hypothetical protein HF086_008043 [Spodoptera exigua]|uniref:Uncharacterized protein n=1 Tax=Spodoptera exigua TaxID=7107 RepID=A0A922M230_SPOEX|nr:hypothetical protein HF086_008043 [Spodoptera exigua]
MERIPFSPDTVNPNTTYLNDLVVDNRDGDYAYITDNSAVDPGIIVFRRSDKKSWKVRDTQSMSSVAEATLFRINGTSVELPVNIDGIALGPQYRNEEGKVDRKVYYCPLSSYHLYAINASVLQNESLSQQGKGALRPYVVDLGYKASQTDGMKMDSTGVLFYGLIGNSTIAEWNTTVDFRAVQLRKNLVSVNEVNYRILKSHTGSKSYVFSEDLSEPTSATGQQSAAAAPALASSLLLLAMAHLLA